MHYAEFVERMRKFSQQLGKTPNWDPKYDAFLRVQGQLNILLADVPPPPPWQLRRETTMEQIIEIDEDGNVHGNDLEHAIGSALNRYSAENASDTPDFILAQYLLGCLAAWNQAVQQRESWYGRDPRPTTGALPVPPRDQEPTT